LLESELWGFVGTGPQKTALEVVLFAVKVAADLTQSGQEAQNLERKGISVEDLAN
jgi:hypothetical protein